ncbi:MAG: translation initiation factor IF-2 [bacterium]
MASTLEINGLITVGALADSLRIPPAQLIGELFKNGMMVTVNEKIDFDTAQIIVSELGMDIELTQRQAEAPTVKKDRKTDDVNAKVRPPVVAVMGHVDHGKTSLLDAIRGANVVKGEAGGITQHISAYQVEKNGRQITLLDTPGHEAFAALREHGARLTDLVVIVVAADDGIKPQTLEAIRFARKAGVKMLVAANKIDKEGANLDRLKQQLSENDLMPEEWGGQTVVLPVSAKTGKGVPELLDMILLIADVEDLKAVHEGPAEGLVIESHMETGRGPVAEALVETGTLKAGDFIVAGGVYGKVRNLDGTNGKPLKTAGPSTPVVISGLKALPEFGDIFTVYPNEKAARLAASTAASSRGSAGKLDMSGTDLLRIISQENQQTQLNIIVKADVQGSLTSVIDSLKTLETKEVSVKIVGSGVGNITENDMHLAATTNAILYGFHVDLPSGVKQLIAREKVAVRLYKVIYELIDDVRAELTTLLSPEIIEKDLGRMLVKGIFKITKNDIICGGEVTKGKLVVPSLVKVFRGNEEIAEIEATLLKRGPVETSEVQTGEMCGVSLKTKTRVDMQEGDRLEFFTREALARSL